MSEQIEFDVFHAAVPIKEHWLATGSKKDAARSSLAATSEGHKKI
jgi:hypothetical protein